MQTTLAGARLASETLILKQIEDNLKRVQAQIDAMKHDFRPKSPWKRCSKRPYGHTGHFRDG